ncbi:MULTISPECIES: hypothetical protein [Cyanophyceae]|nr:MULTISPECIES: hypothetical protein [Cyanophyceae]SMH49188.1 hypothetical protein SAMN06272755_2055 [Picosynechococcus sp. OG1]SMQ81509.1 hypothetical protein SAMN06272774_1331 [Synechococcus sp. 7002]
MRMRKEKNETLRAMERVWARHMLKQQDAQNKNADAVREAKEILNEYGE